MLETFLFLFLLHNISAVKLYEICADIRPDSLIADLDYDHVSRQNEALSLFSNNNFELNGRLLKVKSSLALLVSNSSRLEILANDKTNRVERIIVVYVKVTEPCGVQFNSPQFSAEIIGNPKYGDVLNFTVPIIVNSKKKLTFKQIHGQRDLIYITSTSSGIQNNVKIRLNAREFEDNSRVGLGVFEGSKLLASSLLFITKKKDVDVLFDQSQYEIRTPIVLAQKNLIRVHAKVSSGSVIYGVEPEDGLFDIQPITGDVFCERTLRNGHYSFVVRAVHSSGKTVRASVNVIIGQERRRNQRSLHNRRYRGSDLQLQIPENENLGFLQEKITLHANEIVKSASKGPLRVHSNGSLELTEPLNFELADELQVHVKIGSADESAGRSQVINVRVEDVPEPPVFINKPIPFRAVIPKGIPRGFQLFKFQARNENGDGNDFVEYRLINTEPKETFTVDPNTGVVRTNIPVYSSGLIYRVFVQAHNRKNPLQKSEVAVLELFANELAPQFMQVEFSAVIPENTPIGSNVLQLEIHEFPSTNTHHRKRRPHFSLSSDNYEHPFFGINPDTGVISLLKEADYDEMSNLKEFRLTGVVNQEGEESRIPVIIKVTDVNDNRPIFSQALYTTSVKENISRQDKILQIQAHDKDGGDNGRIFYSVNHPGFTIDELGQIFITNKLDADKEREHIKVYKFNVTASDGGSPPLNDSAIVHLRVENTNDEAPQFLPTAEYTAELAEDARGNTPVVQVRAVDADNDGIQFFFVTSDGGRSDRTKHFQIDKDTGLIRLLPSVKATDLINHESPVVLQVGAVDDGSCCQDGSNTIHVSTAVVRVYILDVNNNRPEFPECNIYSNNAKLEEGVYSDNAPVIIRVKAIDNDTAANGNIVYTLYYSKTEQRHPFVIDSFTGDIRPAPGFLFDREQKNYEEVTVKASDRAERPLIGFCQFTVQILDLNDNVPQFDRTQYETTIARTTRPGSAILSVTAEDADFQENARISYRLKPDSSISKKHEDDYKYFELISEETAEIGVKQEIPRDVDKLIFLVEGKDHGKPSKSSTVQVTVNVHEENHNAPQWQNTPSCPSTVNVDEDIQKNSVLFKCYALSGDAQDRPITYSMSSGAKPSTNSKQTFREFKQKINGVDWVIIRNMETLNYEQIQNYTLTLTSTDMHSMIATDRKVSIIVNDKNDEIPRFPVDRFTGTILEELTPDEHLQKFQGQPITTVKAEDFDSPGPQSDIRYKIVDQEAKNLFRIDEVTGEIFPLTSFDRETKDTYIFDVEASDSSPSSLPGTEGPNKDLVKIHISVTDINDNPPHFEKELYEATLNENAELQTEVMVIKAKDIDEQSTLRYNLESTEGEKNIPFGVKTESGAIFVKEILDYEDKKEYNLILTVTDGIYNNSTKVLIHVKDVNDNPPVFEQHHYEVSIDEENPHVPVVLFKVNATDTDAVSKHLPVVYHLEGQGVGEYFDLDPIKNEVRALKPLDRDPPNGNGVWEFVIHAIDGAGGGLSSYATARITLRDINDNTPHFQEPLTGFVDENREPGRAGTYIMTVMAVDQDDPTTENGQVEYRISVNKEIDGQAVFKIDPNSGKLLLMKKLDRELSFEKEFVIEVRANDKGYPPREGAANVTIKVVDVNDNPPYFEQNQYNISIPENQPVDSAIYTFVAFDLDNEARNNIFSYDLQDSSEKFYITTEVLSTGQTVGVLRVKQPLDYEDPDQRHGFAMQVKVFDGRFSGSTGVLVQLKDINDNSPVINGPRLIHCSEATALDTTLAHFTVSDQDENDKITYRINRNSDPKRQFSIGQDGALKTIAPLDREEIRNYALRIEAFDHVGNVGTQFVDIYIDDENDNAPMPYFASPCVFMENTPISELKPCEIRAYDKDSEKNGPPFKMEVASGFKHADLVNVKFDQYLDGGKGGMIVTPIAPEEFDREVLKFIEIPLNVTDVGGNSGLESVFIVIGDQNDSPMTDGQMEIIVYSYEGQLNRQSIGRVYVEDKDDWDLASKSFSMKSHKYFSIDNQGQITIEADTPAGYYNFDSDVYDNERKESAKGSVKVVVRAFSQPAFENQAAIRIQYNPKVEKLSDFLDKRDAFVNLLKKIVFDSKDDSRTVDVDIFSIQPSEFDPTMYDVRFTVSYAHRFLSKTIVEGLIAAHLGEFKRELNKDTITVGIDMCLVTRCDNGCQTKHTASNSGDVVANNKTVLVGIHSTSQDVCECPLPTAPLACSYNYCYNGGICHNLNPGATCECRKDLPGHRCQGNTRNFDGSGYTWHKSMPACTSLNISFAFKTENVGDSVILYNGPFNSDSLYKDYIYVGIEDSFLVVRQLNGRIEAAVTLKKIVNDNDVHKVLIVQTHKKLEVFLDNCRPNDFECYGVTESDDDERLNVVNPLQLGGFYGDLHVTFPTKNLVGFKGCIMDLIVNGEEYDLETPELHRSSKPICDCETNGCINGKCLPRVRDCRCSPGYVGETCDRLAPWYELLHSSSYANFIIPASSDQNARTDIDIDIVLPRDSKDGQIIGLSDTNTAITLTGKAPTANIQGQEAPLKFHNLQLTNGVPYHVNFHQDSYVSKMSVDYTTHTSRISSDASKGLPDIHSISVGAEHGSGFVGCVRGLKFNNLRFDNMSISNMDNMVNDQASAYGLQEGCQHLVTCEGLGSAFCPAGQICSNHWKGPICTCPAGAVSLLNNDGTLSQCNEVAAVSSLGISSNALIMILACLAVLVCLVVMMMVYANRRKTLFNPVRPAEEFRNDNMRNYNTEGGGETDNNKYNLTSLRKPVMSYPVEPQEPTNHYDPEVDNTYRDPNSGPFDELRIYNEEGDTVSMLSLDSLVSRQVALDMDNRDVR